MYYKIAVFLSGLSAFFGLFREVLIVYFLGFSAKNDQLQAYLSIIYILLLSTDAVKLASLNLFNHFKLSEVIRMASVLLIPLAMVVTIVVGLMLKGSHYGLLLISFIGGYLALLTVIVITYKQRGGKFFVPQIINLIPNFILIPCLVISYYAAKEKIIFYMVLFSTLIPVAQLFLLSFVKVNVETNEQKIAISEVLMIFIRHMSSSFPAQLFQVLARALTYRYNAGYLSIFSFTNRVYTAAKFVITDSYIGLSLAKQNKKSSILLDKLFVSKKINYLLLISMTFFLLIFSLYENKFYFGLELTMLCCVGFYFDYLLKVQYFKLNRDQHNKNLIILYSLCEWTFAVIAYLVAGYFLNLPIWYMWSWFLLRPFVEILLITYKGGINVKKII